jgi:hypothetical protein
MRRLTLSLSLLAAVGCASQSGGLPPLPSDTRMVSPASGVPRDRAAFAGHWVGKWDGKHDTALVVEEVQPTEAQVLVGWASAPALGLESPAFVRHKAEFADGALRVRVFRLVPPATLTYWMKADGNLDARYERGSTTRQATLTRVTR